MKLYHHHNGHTCVALQALVERDYPLKPTIQKDGTTRYWMWSKWAREARKIGGHTRPGGNGRLSLIQFDFIPPKYREDIRARYGSPDETAGSHSMLEEIEQDLEAARFYAHYTYDDNKFLPKKHQERYTANACVLNCIKMKFTRTLNARMGGNMRGFWPKISKAVYALRSEFPHKLPKNHQSLQRVYNQYMARKDAPFYECLIDGRFGNINRQKITPEIEAWMIRQLASTRQSIDMIYMRYYDEAQRMDWPTDITLHAFRARAREQRIQDQVVLARFGRKGYRKLNGHYHKLLKPKYSNDIWMGDGSGTGWCYLTKDNAIGYATTYFVMDSLSGKFLAWETNEGINKEDENIIRRTWRDALRKTAYTPPYQIKVDHQKGHKTTATKELFSNISKVLTYSRPYRSSSRDIERKFKVFQQTKLSEFFFWSGFGRDTHSDITNAPNMELMEKNKEHLPSFNEIIQLLEVVVNEWNDMSLNGKESPNEIYAANADPEAKPLELDQISTMFFDVQGPKKYGNSGIKLRHDKEDHLYEVYDTNGDVDFNFRHKYLHRSFYIKHDPVMEFKEIDLLIKHPTGGYQKIATALPKRAINESVRYHNEGDVAWALRQMDKEEGHMDVLDAKLEGNGYSEGMKFSTWRTKLNNEVPTMANDDEEDDPQKLFLNRA